MPRHAVLEVDLDAIAANVAVLRRAAPYAELCAVVKADGYGHGAVPAARAALAGGATWLAVALVEEGVALRDAGLDAPILVLSQPPVDSMADALAADLVPTLYTREGIAAAVDAAASVGRTGGSVGRTGGSGGGSAGAAGGGSGGAAWSVHLKVDTGMHRVGADPEDAVELAAMIDRSDALRLGGVFTHLACADEPGHPLTVLQLSRFETVLQELREAGIDTDSVHAANSAALLLQSRSHGDLVRAGIAIYGIDPVPGSGAGDGLVPALSLRSEVSFVRAVPAGDGVSYGMRHLFDRPATVAVVPLGYADGVPRNLGLSGGEVLIGGRRHPIRGVVTMDQLVVETTGADVAPGDEVVLIGTQGDQVVTAQEWAWLTDTIPYEIVCGFSARLPRRYSGAATGRA